MAPRPRNPVCAILMQTCKFHSRAARHNKMPKLNRVCFFSSTEGMVQSDMSQSAHESEHVDTKDAALETIGVTQLQMDPLAGASIEGPEHAAMPLELPLNDDMDMGTASLSEDGSVCCIVLCFNRHPKEFEEALLQSDLAKALAQRSVDMQPSWAHGAKIFVEGLTEEALQHSGIVPQDLRPWHVIAQKEDEASIHAVLHHLKYRIRPRVRSAETIHLHPGNASSSNSAQDTGEMQVVVYQTFIHVVESKAISPRTDYTRSSTDRLDLENPGRIRNPRLWGSP
mmetsp:Transcript_56716/g.109518  ORF Transcript_56716/g.109518 Transcript_56716/m.109518 type:complete len:283 (-) Transcript_56716:118-966(-)